MKDPEEKIAAVIELSDRRPTPKEVPVFVPGEPSAAEASSKNEFWTAMEPLLDGLQGVQGQILTRLIQLALPEMKRFQRSPIREVVRTSDGLPEEMLKELEARLGTHPARVRRTKWLDASGYIIGRDYAVRGAENARPGESGMIQGRCLVLLEDGRLGLIEVVGTWVWRMGLHHYDSLTTVGDAELIDPVRAVREFPLAGLITSLRSILFYDDATPLGPPGPELLARRERFMATVKDLSKATAAYVERIRRAGIGPA
ncbi:hypothetical protein JRI60_25345 [Archangium violaceum]|uniref:hypothetical protein n=1 Tax=Archangium violaceum TaxID=83451 RepID=UPI00194EBBA8|nr:hypothetical protein [Archangium violaceum]QRO02097.1 hypothetical protein JRI60_25345 [Archangium violaceum]